MNETLRCNFGESYQRIRRGSNPRPVGLKPSPLHCFLVHFELDYELHIMSQKRDSGDIYGSIILSYVL